MPMLVSVCSLLPRKNREELVYKAIWVYVCVCIYPRSQAPPSFASLLVWKSGRGPGILSHVSDVRIERMVEKV